MAGQPGSILVSCPRLARKWKRAADRCRHAEYICTPSQTSEQLMGVHHWRILGLTLVLTLPADTWAEARLPIIDMHLHARKADYIGSNPPPMCTPFEVMPRWDPAQSLDAMTFNKIPPCKQPIPAARTDEEVLRQTIAVMNKRNIIGMVSGEPEQMEVWKAAAPARIIVGSDLRISASSHPHVQIRTADELRQLRSRGLLDVLGEVMAQYEGITPDDARLEPYWELAESLDIP